MLFKIKYSTQAKVIQFGNDLSKSKNLCFLNVTHREHFIDSAEAKKVVNKNIVKVGKPVMVREQLADKFIN